MPCRTCSCIQHVVYVQSNVSTLLLLESHSGEAALERRSSTRLGKAINHGTDGADLCGIFLRRGSITLLYQNRITRHCPPGFGLYSWLCCMLTSTVDVTGRSRTKQAKIPGVFIS